MKAIQLLLLAAVATSTVLGVTTPTSSNTPTIPTATTETLTPTNAKTPVAASSSTASSSSTDTDSLDITSSADIIATSDSASTGEAGLSKEEDPEPKRPAKADSDSGPTGNGGGAIPPRSGAPLPESDAMIATLGSVATVVVAVGAYFL
ncbi:unnamed protein product [Peronospora destructor]|uniref:Uncharacterized protein n=1 Tax=Peronospora destructor TaxID=86335 RepID=A0AAV0TCM1_9STRA|nr:unnamed protein product [Peronospora destructor]